MKERGLEDRAVVRACVCAGVRVRVLVCECVGVCGRRVRVYECRCTGVCNVGQHTCTSPSISSTTNIGQPVTRDREPCCWFCKKLVRTLGAFSLLCEIARGT